MLPSHVGGIVLAAVLCAQSIPAPLAPAVAPAPPSGAITGIVYDATTNQPLAGAVVTLARVDGTQALPRAVTDSKGRFVFRFLEPSTEYYLGARRFGYEYTRYGWTGPNQTLLLRDIRRIAVAKDQWVDGIRIPLWRAGSISGRVTDERGEPLVGVAVRVFSLANISGTRQIVAGDIATTDDIGLYRISGLLPGSYTVAVLSVQSTVPQSMRESPATLATGQLASGGIGAGRGSSVSAPTVDVDGRHRLVITNFATPPPPSLQAPHAYPATFYPGVLTLPDAAQVNVAYGDSLTGIDIQVRPIPAVRVSGRLTTPSGEPPPVLLLRLMPIGAEYLGFGSEAATTVPDADGNFVFLNVPAGQYTLMAQASVMDFTSGSTSRRFPDAPGFPGGGIAVGSTDGAPGLGYLSRNGAPSAFWARTSLTVGTRDVTNAVVPLRRTVTVYGRVVLPPGLSLSPNTRMELSAEPAGGNPASGQPRGVVDLAKPDLPFTISGLVGDRYLLTYLLTASLQSTVRVASITWQGRDIRYAGLDTTSTDEIHDVVVTMTDQKIELKGMVSGNDGPTAAAVLAFPVDRSRWTDFGLRPVHLGGTRSAPSGAYSFDRLPEGDYYLVAVDTAHVDSWVDARFLAAAMPLATRVSVKWGDVRTQDLKVQTVVVK